MVGREPRNFGSRATWWIVGLLVLVLAAAGAVFYWQANRGAPTYQATVNAIPTVDANGNARVPLSITNTGRRAGTPQCTVTLDVMPNASNLLVNPGVQRATSRLDVTVRPRQTVYVTVLVPLSADAYSTVAQGYQADIQVAATCQ
ncbi:MAG: hypothetical protein ACYCYA_13915 [Actinomycetes bacterium]